MATLTFLGAAGTVTGSRYVLEAGGERLMIDCGAFEGSKELRLRNWSPLPVGPGSIRWLVLTHAHLDHTGYIPRFIKEGFRGEIYSTSGTLDLAHLLLPIPATCKKKTRRLPTARASPSTRPPCRFTPMTMP